MTTEISAGPLHTLAFEAHRKDLLAALKLAQKIISKDAVGALANVHIALDTDEVSLTVHDCARQLTQRLSVKSDVRSPRRCEVYAPLWELVDLLATQDSRVVTLLIEVLPAHVQLSVVSGAQQTSTLFHDSAGHKHLSSAPAQTGYYIEAADLQRAARVALAFAGDKARPVLEHVRFRVAPDSRFQLAGSNCYALGVSYLPFRSMTRYEQDEPADILLHRDDLTLAMRVFFVPTTLNMSVSETQVTFNDFRTTLILPRGNTAMHYPNIDRIIPTYDDTTPYIVFQAAQIPAMWKIVKWTAHANRVRLMRDGDQMRMRASRDGQQAEAFCSCAGPDYTAAWIDSCINGQYLLAAAKALGTGKSRRLCIQQADPSSPYFLRVHELTDADSDFVLIMPMHAES